MNVTKHRTSFALDEETTDRLRRLAQRWAVSQAEVVRRAVKLASDQAAAEADSVQERLDAYRKSSRIARREADDYLAQVNEERERWARDQ